MRPLESPNIILIIYDYTCTHSSDNLLNDKLSGLG